MDFLAGYYQQDGDHSAVTGGEGDESLQDFASVIKINIPINDKNSLQLDSRLSYFTSASSDEIDPKTISGASRHDLKVNIQARVNRQLKTESRTFYYELGASHEAHFASVNAGIGISGKFRAGQSEWQASTAYTMDVWGPHYNLSRLYPSDYFGADDLSTNKRHSLGMTFGMKHDINSSVNIGFTAGVYQQFGLLSTPFHRIYFHDEIKIDIERLPAYRVRMPVTGRMNFYATDWLIFRSYYRFYWDNFELKSHTVYLEIPVKPSNQLSVYPFYRFHHQQGHEYFDMKGMHSVSDQYYTSDFDQGDLHSHFVGGGFKWTPFFAKRKKADRRIEFEAVEARGAFYTRSDDFHSWIISGSISWLILRKKPA